MPRAFANLDGLVRLSRNEGVDIRRPLLRILTDLYVQEKHHTREEEQQYVELVLRLLPAVDLQTRTAIAQKLFAYPLTPATLLEALMRDAPGLAPLPDRGAQTTSVDTNAKPTDSSNSGTGPTTPASELHGFSAPLSTGMPTRSGSVGEKFLDAGGAERSAMLDRLEAAESATAFDALHLPARPGTSKRLERAALQCNQQEFARELRLALGISSRTAWLIIQDDSGEPLMVAAKVLEVPVVLFVRVLLFLNPAVGQSVERVFALTRRYQQLSPEAVAPIVASWREDAARPAARFQPLHAPDAATSAASARDNARKSKDAADDQSGRRAAFPDPRLRGQGTT